MLLQKSGRIKLHLVIGRVFNTPISIIRPFNTYGPRQSARAVIPTIISQIASGNKDIFFGFIKTNKRF